MNLQELATLLAVSRSKLCELARDPENLERIVSIAYNEGGLKGTKHTVEAYNQAFRGYDKVTITN